MMTAASAPSFFDPSLIRLRKVVKICINPRGSVAAPRCGWSRTNLEDLKGGTASASRRLDITRSRRLTRSASISIW